MTDLRAIAEAASEIAPGPWEFGWEETPADAPADFWAWGIITRRLGDGNLVIATSTPGGRERSPDPVGEYIAALSPDRALAALDVIEAADKIARKPGANPYLDDLQRLRAALNRWDALG